MVGGSSSKKSSVQKASSQGAWLGSDVDEGHIEALRHHRVLPPASQVLVRLPSSETAPAPAAGEVVVFVEHFYRGFGLPASSFFTEWLHFFGLQPHYLAPNAILQLAAFVVLCEGLGGIEPRVDLWRRLFFFKQQSIAMEKSEVEKLKGPCPMTLCGAVLVHHPLKSGFPQMPLQESIKHWQKGFFYVKSVNPAQDALNMPPFAIAPPTRRNWDAKTPRPHPEVALICTHLDILEKSGLLGRDLLATMVVRRILPLQRRPHLVCQMSGRLDPCRLSTKRFTTGTVARRPVALLSLWLKSFSYLFETLQGSLRQPAPDVEVPDASEIENEGAMEPCSDSSAGSEDPLESEGTEPFGEYTRPAVADWTDDDEVASFYSGAAFEENSDEVEEVTSPPLTRGRCQGGGATAADEAAEKKGKGATASRPASKRPAPSPPVGQRASGAKRRRGGGRRQVPVVAGEAEDADEDTASAAERAGWAAADAAQRELEIESKRRWDMAAGKAAVGQPCPRRVERPVEKRAKTRHDPSAHARAEEPASEAASRPAPRTEGAQPSEPEASAQVDLETIPDSPRAEAAPDAPELDLAAPDMAPDAPGATMDAPDAAHPPPAEEVVPARMAPEPAVELAPGAGAIVVPLHGPVATGAESRAGSRPMRTWRAANLARLRLPAGTVLSGVPELVTMFSSSRSKVEQSARVVCSDMERLEARTQVQAYDELRTQHLGADSRIADLEAWLGEVTMEHDALRNAGGRLQEQLDLLQAEKKELEAADWVDLERLRATLQEKEASYSADVDRLASLHLKEVDLKDAALREKDEALVQKQTQLAKALESAATLQEDVARLTHASKVREHEVLEVSHENDGAFHRLFPETQIAADTAVELCHEERHATGQEVDTTSGWSVEEIGVGLRDRMRALGESVAQLQVAGSSMVAALWPERVEPASMGRLARWLAVGGERLDAWRASVARSGAYMALRLAKSWYRNLNLGKLVAQRDGSEAELQGMEEELRVRASAVAEYAAWDDFVLERGEDGGVIAEDLHGLQPYDTDGSSDEAVRAAESAAASSSAAYADSDVDGAGGLGEGDGATTSGAAKGGDATTSGAAAETTNEAAVP
ncbi:hypothetical protein D1007_48610 [Hordeum vulgare]|nr:hypothetical protein D1007_48610 [Hordeum vulgare]